MSNSWTCDEGITEGNPLDIERNSLSVDNSDRVSQSGVNINSSRSSGDALASMPEAPPPRQPPAARNIGLRFLNIGTLDF